MGATNQVIIERYLSEELRIKGIGSWDLKLKKKTFWKEHSFEFHRWWFTFFCCIIVKILNLND
jgi:hypothetical protein